MYVPTLPKQHAVMSEFCRNYTGKTCPTTLTVSLIKPLGNYTRTDRQTHILGLLILIYVVSKLPHPSYQIKFLTESQLEQSKFWNIYFYRFSIYMMFFNIISNFYIYTLTLTSFREFLRARVRFLLAPLLRCCSPTGSTNERVGERRRLLD